MTSNLKALARPSGSLPSVAKEQNPCAFATRLLNEARQKAASTGDKAPLASALIDMAIVLQREGKYQGAATLLLEALDISHLAGDQSAGNKSVHSRDRCATALEIDILGNLGLAYLGLGDTARAMEVFLAEHAAATDLGSASHALQTALSHLGLACVYMGQPARAIAYLEPSIELAWQVGDRQGLVDIHWEIAIQHAELGQRDRALEHAQAAIDLLSALGNPAARTYAECLAKFSFGTGSLEPFATPAPCATAGSPGLLRMAFTIAQSLARSAAAGFKTVSRAAYDQRRAICGACEHHTGVRCRICSCFTPIKARLPHENCPLQKWPVNP